MEKEFHYFPEKRPIENQGLKTGYLVQHHTWQQTEVKDHPARLIVACGQQVDHPTIFSFLDRNYRYKSIAAQIPHNAGTRN